MLLLSCCNSNNNNKENHIPTSPEDVTFSTADWIIAFESTSNERSTHNYSIMLYCLDPSHNLSELDFVEIKIDNQTINMNLNLSEGVFVGNAELNEGQSYNVQFSFNGQLMINDTISIAYIPYVSFPNAFAYNQPCTISWAENGVSQYQFAYAESKLESQDYREYASEIVSVDINGYTYTGPRYRRDFQYAVEDTLCTIHSYDIYDNAYFNLDATNSPSFYNDIGLYNKYIFGWVDWYLTYAEEGVQGTQIANPNPHPIFAWSSNNNDPGNLWIGNRPLSNPEGYYDAPNSAMRSQYLALKNANNGSHYSEFVKQLDSDNHSYTIPKNSVQNFGIDTEYVIGIEELSYKVNNRIALMSISTDEQHYSNTNRVFETRKSIDQILKMYNFMQNKSSR